jgi:hypothetical protein
MPTPNPDKKPALAKLPGALRLAFKGLDDWIEVFQAGTRTDSKGRTSEFTADDLDQMAANVSGAGVPAVIGHPKDTHRAWAWAKPGAVKRVGQSLYAKFADIHAAFRAAVDEGAYRERSISIHKDPQRGWVLDHIGWLGAAAPAVTGMEPLSYSAPADAVDCYEFAMDDDSDAGYALSGVAELLRGLRDYVISKDGIDLADRLLPGYRIDSIAAAADRIVAASQDDDDGALKPLYSQHKGASMTISQADLDAAVAAAVAKTKLEAEAAAALQFSAQGAELAELRAARQADRIKVQVEGWVRDGLVTPAKAHGMVEFMSGLEDGKSGEFQFTAADNSTAKQTLAKWFADFVGSGKPIRLGHRVTPESEPKPKVDLDDAKAIEKAAKEFMHAELQAGRTVTITEAVHRVTTAG